MSRSTTIVLAVLVIGFFGFAILTPKTKVALIGVDHADEGRKHLASIDEKHESYKTNSPTSGPHYTSPAKWGISDAQIPDEQLVHNLEHGGVVISYLPTISSGDLTKLKDIARNLTMRDTQESNKGFKVILHPRAENTSLIQLSSWRYSYNTKTVDVKQIQRFYRDRPNTAPEANAR